MGYVCDYECDTHTHISPKVILCAMGNECDTYAIGYECDTYVIGHDKREKVGWLPQVCVCVCVCVRCYTLWGGYGQ